MREKIVKRFYCEHCAKGLFKRAAMLRHESMCVRNPNRVCPMCAEAKFPQPALPDLLSAIEKSLDALRDEASGCPACMLAAIVQSKGEIRKDEHGGDPTDWIDFDYKTARAEWLSEQDARSERHFG